MPDQADAPQRPPRRSRRIPKAPREPLSSQTPSKTPTNLSSQEDSDMGTSQSTQILGRGEPAMTQVAMGHLAMDSSAPSTPPRSHSTQPSSTRRDQIGSESVSGPKQIRDGARAQPAKQKALPKPQQGGTPSTAIRPNAMTPGRASETPSKAAYAGPTFHASPAASSLPLPKFFSKSVSNVDKTTSLKNMMEPDAADTTSENTTSESEGSPLVDHAQPDSDRGAREESPLDIFFQADRKAKANAGTAAIANGTKRNSSPFQSPQT